jgi:alpha-1,6-mannosyltransferase
MIHSEIAARPDAKPYWKQRLVNRRNARRDTQDPLAPTDDSQEQ